MSRLQLLSCSHSFVRGLLRTSPSVKKIHNRLVPYTNLYDSTKPRRIESEPVGAATFGGFSTPRGDLACPDTLLTVEPILASSPPLPFHNPHISRNMSSKRKWDQAAPEVDSEVPSKATKTEDAKTASEAAATAAAIAAKIAAQFANGGTGGGGKDPYDGEFTHDIDINDLRNRYLLTRGSTQQQVRANCVPIRLFLKAHRFSSRVFFFFPFVSKIHEETGASVSTKGTWYPDRSKATDRDPPLYLHIAANTQEILQSAIVKVKDLIDTDLGSLVEDKKDRQRERVRARVLYPWCREAHAHHHSANGQRKSSPLVSSR